MGKRGSLADRFWAKVSKQDECWLWTGAVKNSGYGTMSRGGRAGGMVNAHRVSWELHFGAIPTLLMVLHKCDVKLCVNPSHLFLGTAADNNRDSADKGRMHPGEQNGGAKLTVAQVLEIRRLRPSGKRTREVAVSLGVNPSAIRKILLGLKWKHLA